MSSKKIPSKKRLTITILSITTSLFLLTAFLSVAPASFVNAVFQNQHNNTISSNFGGGGGGKPLMYNGFFMNGINNNNNIHQINGTINLLNSTGNISLKNISVPFITAAQSAQSAISNGRIINGHIGITQGFLTYNFAVSNPTNNTISKVIVDAGNGKILYTSPGISLNSTQFAMRGMNGGGFGPWANHGMNGGGFGPWANHGNRGW